MPISSEDVDLIYAKLSITYGHRFLSIWDGMPEEDVKADWAQTLEGASHESILWALKNLPARAPDAPAFRELCRQYRAPVRTALPPPTPKAGVPTRIAAAVHHVLTKSSDPRPERWRAAERRVRRIRALERPLSPQEHADLAHFGKILREYEGTKA